MPFNLDEYEPVEDRLRAFWEQHPHGRVATELVYTGTDGYIVKASIFREQFITPGTTNDCPAATGYAQEAVTERGVNATSALENCETSAIGRALANMGYAAKGKRPSREEMAKPARQRASGAPSSASASLPVSSAGGAPEPRPSVVNAHISAGKTSAPADTTSGSGAGEAGAAPEGYGEGPDGAVPSTTDLATEEDWQTATKNGLTTARAKAIAKGLGITVTSAVDLTRADFSRVINKYLEMQAAKK